MVKVECLTDNEGSSIDDSDLNANPGVDSIDLKPCSVPIVVKEESVPSSSNNHLKLYLIGMGFSSILVDKVIEENGEADVNVLLEALLEYSAHQKSSPTLKFRSDYSSLNKEDSLPSEFKSDDNQIKKERDEPSHVHMEKKTYLLMMEFMEEEIDLAISRLGETAPLGELVEFIVTSQAAGSSGKKENLRFSRGVSGYNEESTTEALFGTMNKTLCLLRMGFTDHEISSAIHKLGSDAPLNELADSIIVVRLAFEVKEEDLSDDGCYFNPEEQEELDQLVSAKDEHQMPSSSTETWLNYNNPNSTFEDYEHKANLKKAKYSSAKDKEASNWSQWDNTGSFEHLTTNLAKNSECAEFPSTSTATTVKEEAAVKEETPDPFPCSLSSNNRKIASKSPFFFYGNVIDISQDTWRKLSQFLYGTQPEFVNCQFFSALIRKEGYLHNLPTVGRFHIVPKSPMTIEDALPHTKKFWPSWDTRKQLSCINSETTGVAQLCDRLGRMMATSHGVLSKEQQIDILHHCKTLNLIWVGPNKLSPINPEHLEQILGYPRHHTDFWGMEPTGRLRALKHSFQTDTFGYHFSVLKNIFPQGVRLISICSGIGGAEVAIHRLGVRLRCVVSVEESESNRKILRQWWNHTGQSGVLKQLSGVEMLTIRCLENLVKEFGGFDIVVGGNPGYFASSGSSKESSVGMDLNHFYEFARVLQRVRGLRGRRN
ncbi:DNA (cytosine-5)-methyltransferase DRM1 [Apostasia shenzhenica]|uniref:DNA (Cytosine-5)-methyltransferase DRM1 n=1 Tax=Apostasia shenzhenica TaxID=1088818 RepID=A0A2I0AGS7_9ASPA|nr:DNA (cytosine-5)-methyltransferase DRM1 [Apostasia shenzhenica]